MNGRNRLPAPDGYEVGLPTDVEAEERVVGSVLLRSSALEDPDVAQLKPADFVDALHAVAFATLLTMRRDGIPFDVMLVKRALHAHRAFAESRITPAVYLANVGMAVVTAMDAGYFARLVRRAARKRELSFLFDYGAHGSRNGSEPDDLIDDIVARATALRATKVNDRSTRKIIAECRHRAANRIRPPMIHCGPIGSPLRDLVVGEGILTTIAGQSSHGKSAMAHQMAIDALRLPEQQDLRVLIASVEMSPEEILVRQCARLVGIDSRHIFDATFAIRHDELVDSGYEQLDALRDRLHFLAPPFTIENVMAMAEALDARLIVVDYLQRFEAEGIGPDPRLQTNAIMSRAKLLAGQGRGVICISALNRPNGGAMDWTPATVGMRALRESGEIEYASDAIYFVVKNEPEDKGPAIATTLKCAKNRNGVKTSTVLTFHAPLLKFERGPGLAPHDEFAEYAGAEDDPEDDPEEGYTEWR